MHINVTFLIQIANFLITYKILSVFLFKPIIASLEEKKVKKENLFNTIQEKEDQILALEKEKTEKITSFQTYATKKYAFCAPKFYEKNIDIEPKQKISPSMDGKSAIKSLVGNEKSASSTKEKAEIEKKLTNLIVTKVPDAY